MKLLDFLPDPKGKMIKLCPSACWLDPRYSRFKFISNPKSRKKVVEFCHHAATLPWKRKNPNHLEGYLHLLWKWWGTRQWRDTHLQVRKWKKFWFLLFFIIMKENLNLLLGLDLNLLSFFDLYSAVDLVNWSYLQLVSIIFSTCTLICKARFSIKMKSINRCVVKYSPWNEEITLAG